MKKKEFKKLREKKIEDLRKMVGEKKQEVLLKKTKGENVRKLRQEIAKILTLIREKEIMELSNKENK